MNTQTKFTYTLYTILRSILCVQNKEIVLSNLYHMITMAMAINLFNRSVDKKNLAKEVQTTRPILDV